jgi:hypothetical protein
MSKTIIDRRRNVRRSVEMLAHLRRTPSTITVMLKDLTLLGARVEGIADLTEDEAVDLSLPGLRPIISFVVWANKHCAGLQFAEPLHPGTFAELVRTYGLCQQDSDSLTYR